MIIMFMFLVALFMVLIAVSWAPIESGWQGKVRSAASWSKWHETHTLTQSAHNIDFYFFLSVFDISICVYFPHPAWLLKISLETSNCLGLWRVVWRSAGTTGYTGIYTPIGSVFSWHLPFSVLSLEIDKYIPCYCNDIGKGLDHESRKYLNLLLWHFPGQVKIFQNMQVMSNSIKYLYRLLFGGWHKYALWTRLINIQMIKIQDKFLFGGWQNL